MSGPQPQHLLALSLPCPAPGALTQYPVPFLGRPSALLFRPLPSEPSVPFKMRLQDLEVQEKGSATFRCEVPLLATEAVWYKEETRLWASSKYAIEEAGTERRLTVHNATADDDAVYICEMAEGSRTVAELTVQGGRLGNTTGG